MKGEMGEEKRPHPAYVDPIYRISRLAASTRKPLSVFPETKLEEAITHMLTDDFSQLPVMTSEKTSKELLRGLLSVAAWPWVRIVP